MQTDIFYRPNKHCPARSFNSSIMIFLGNVRLNGAPLNGVQWDNIASSSYVVGTFDVPSGSSHTLTTSSGARFYGRLYGKADRESYAFPVGFQF